MSHWYPATAAHSACTLHAEGGVKNDACYVFNCRAVLCGAVCYAIAVFVHSTFCFQHPHLSLAPTHAASLAVPFHLQVVCTIHQPSDDITDLFDQFVLLARGRLLYDGPWRSAVPYFEQQGFR